MLTFYHSPRSRSTRTLWLLEELAAPYEMKVVSVRRGDGTGHEEGAEYRKIHPHAKVPALVHDGATIFETPAIALYLTDLFPDKELGPRVHDPKRGPYLSWLAYSTGVFEPSLIAKTFGFAHKHGTMGWAPIDEVQAVLDRAIEAGPYFLGDCFSAVDIVIGGSLAYVGKALSPNPARDAYIARITGRPAYRRTLERDNELWEKLQR